MRLLRAFTFAFLGVVTSALGFVASTAALVFDPRGGRATHVVAWLWARAILTIAGVRLVVTHGERFRTSEPRVLAVTHASYLDIPAVFVAFEGQLRFIARHNLVWIPFVGWFIKVGGHFTVRRDDPRQALALAHRAADRMRRHRLSAAVFPEATRSRDGRLQPLRPGALQLALEVGVPVQPIVVTGTAAIMPKGSWFPIRSGTVEVRVGEPIPTEGLSGPAGRRELAAAVRREFLRLGARE